MVHPLKAQRRALGHKGGGDGVKGRASGAVAAIHHDEKRAHSGRFDEAHDGADIGFAGLMRHIAPCTAGFGGAEVVGFGKGLDRAQASGRVQWSRARADQL